MERDPSHPRPFLQRAGWRLLDGVWEFAADPSVEHTHPSTIDFDTSITVPFAPETPASGIGFEGELRRCFYRRIIETEPVGEGERVLVHFGAVDREAYVWANGSLVGSHVGGYTPFSVDITDVLDETGAVELVVRADDEPQNLTIPRGKQDWWPTPHIIWYPRTTGIWQSVWVERVPRAHVAALHWSGEPSSMTVSLRAELAGVTRNDRLRVHLHHGDRTLVDDAVVVTDVIDGRATITRTFTIGRPGVDDPFTYVWRPGNPALLEASVELTSSDGVDVVASYAAIRSVAVERGRVVLNGEPTILRLALDQGYWPESGLTAPSVDALRSDVELIRDLGLTGVRKHQKIEDPRWLAFCDELGVLVWEELPSAYAFDPRVAASLTREWIEVVERDRNHPCIVAWVPINESWGVPDVVHQPAQRALVESLTTLTRALDPTRPVSANDGWETTGGDIIGIHDYDQDAEALRERYADADALHTLVVGSGPAGRRLLLDGDDIGDRAVVLSELGGATMSEATAGLFGYGNLSSVDDLVERIATLCGAVLASDVLCGYCWTQLTDTYQEVNGLLHFDRTPKAPIDVLRAALVGLTPS